MTKQEIKENILREAGNRPIPIKDIVSALGIYDVDAQECIEELVEDDLVDVVDSCVVLAGGKNE